MKADPKTPKPESAPVVKKTISLKQSIFKKGERLAGKQSRTFSNYVATLIEADRP